MSLSSAVNDFAARVALEFKNVRGTIGVTIYWTGTAWPTRASSIPSGYTGAVTFDSTTDPNATAPSDALVSDRWLKQYTASGSGLTHAQVLTRTLGA